MLIRGDFLRRHGLLREDFFLYYEDNDMCLRALNCGFDVYYHPLSVVYHKGETSTGKFMDSPQSIYYAVRNGLFFWAEYLPSAVWSYMDFIENNLLPDIYQKEEKLLAFLDALEDFLFRRKGQKLYNLPLDEVVKNHILKVYENTGHNKTKTASVLGIGLNTLRRKLALYGVS